MIFNFKKLAKGDEPGVDKINENFDAIQQNFAEDVKTVEVPLEGDWRNIGSNKLVITITPTGASLRGYIADKDSYLVDSSNSGTATAGFGANAPIAQLPQSVSFRGKNYRFSIGVPVICALGGAGGNSLVNGVRVLDSGNGKLYVYEPKDVVQSNGISINAPLDMFEA